MLRRDMVYRSVLGPYFKRYLEMKASIGRTSIQPCYILREFVTSPLSMGCKIRISRRIL